MFSPSRSPSWILSKSAKLTTPATDANLDSADTFHLGTQDVQRVCRMAHTNSRSGLRNGKSNIKVVMVPAQPGTKWVALRNNIAT